MSAGGLLVGWQHGGALLELLAVLLFAVPFALSLSTTVSSW
jgi:hypothetical protein